VDQADLCAEIGDVLGVASAPRTDGEGVGERQEHVFQSGRPDGLELLDPVIGRARDHEPVDYLVRCEIQRALNVARGKRVDHGLERVARQTVPFQ
jgi:hypothetical protein